MDSKLRQRIIDRRGTHCWCGCGAQGSDMHHALIPRDVRFPQLDAEENLVLVNHTQHIHGLFDNAHWKRRFWSKLCREYTEEHMRKWVNSLPQKLAPRVTELMNLIDN
jgi:cobyric acid synthase